jgi:hypothetical protein
LKGLPQGRWGEPEEVAKAVLFPASDDSSYVNAVELIFVGATNLIPRVSTSSLAAGRHDRKNPARPLMHLHQAIKAPQPSTRGRKRQSAKRRQSLAEFSLTVSSNEAQHTLI